MQQLGNKGKTEYVLTKEVPTNRFSKLFRRIAEEFESLKFGVEYQIKEDVAEIDLSFNSEEDLNEISNLLEKSKF